jgi:hypothetical protein
MNVTLLFAVLSLGLFFAPATRPGRYAAPGALPAELTTDVEVLRIREGAELDRLNLPPYRVTARESRGESGHPYEPRSYRRDSAPPAYRDRALREDFFSVLFNERPALRARCIRSGDDDSLRTTTTCEMTALGGDDHDWTFDLVATRQRDRYRSVSSSGTLRGGSSDFQFEYIYAGSGALYGRTPRRLLVTSRGHAVAALELTAGRPDQLVLAHSLTHESRVAIIAALAAMGNPEPADDDSPDYERR